MRGKNFNSTPGKYTKLTDKNQGFERKLSILDT